MNDISTQTDYPFCSLTLQNAESTGYELIHRRGSTVLFFRMFDGGIEIWREDVRASAQEIERLLTTALCAGRAIKEDDARGSLENFTKTSVDVAGVRLTLERADPTTNDFVLCTFGFPWLKDPASIGLGVEFVIPSDVLWEQSKHLAALIP